MNSFYENYDLRNKQNLIELEYIQTKILVVFPQLILNMENSIENKEQTIYSQMLEKIGSFGPYQKLTMVFWCLIGYLTGGITMIAPFIFYQDPYKCNNLDSESCITYVCSLDINQRKKYWPDSTMITIANQFGDFRCPAQFQYLGVLQLIIYSSIIVGYIILSLIGQKTGRKSLIIINMLISIIGLIIATFSVNMVMVTAGLFLVFLGSQNSVSLSFVYITEVIGEDYRDKCSAAVMLFEQIGILFNVGGFFLLRNWRYVLIYLYLIPTVLTFIAMIFILIESPIKLINEDQQTAALDAFKKISDFNCKKQLEITLNDINNLKKIQQKSKQSERNNSEQSISCFSLFSFASLRNITIFLCIFDLTNNFLYYGPVLMLDKFHLDIFVNGLVMGVADLLAAILTILIIGKIKRKTTAYVSVGICLVCSLILLFIWVQDSNDVSSDFLSHIGQYIIIFVFRFAIIIEYTVFQIYINQIYPAQVRVSGTSLVCCVGGAMATFTPLILNSAINASFKVMIIFSISSVMGLISTYYLPQTLGKVPQNLIKQLTVKDRKIHSQQIVIVELDS